ncbi:MAG: pyridoxal phosphate-dependent aminotransferase [bacterium]
MRAAELKREGKDVIGLGMGEPDFGTPEHISAAGIQAIKDGQTRYTAVDGTPELKAAIIQKFKNENLLEYEPSQILVSSGAKQSLYNLMVALLNEGDEVIIPAPYWVSYPDMAILADGVPVIVEAGPEQNFKITAAQLEAAITPRTRLLVLNSPSNPTGMAYSAAELAAIGAVLKANKDVWIVSDDIYEHIFWGKEKFQTLLNVCPDLSDRTITINGVSKAYAMTGWRIGYAVGTTAMIAGMRKVQGQSTSNPCSISQAAAVAALSGDQSCIKTMTTAFQERHNFIVDALNKVPGFHCLPADGAFYAFPDVREAIKKLDGVNNDVELAEFFLNNGGVATVPGSAFGAPGHLRLSYATSIDVLEDAIGRMKAALESA